jgi:p-cumate 2,3-dioxygenase alpha subunit
MDRAPHEQIESTGPHGLVDDDAEAGLFRVHRSALTSPEVLEQERRRVFDRSWLYVGHDSEIPNAGDFRRRNVGGRSIMFVRGDDLRIRAFHNSCPHRGAIVCRKDAGTSKAFQCFYHAWTFDSRGRLVGVPGKDAYDDSRFSKEERSLRHVPRLESYRGLNFLSYWPEIVSLEEYLGNAKEYIDIMCDQSLSGEMRVTSGTQQYSSRANWKLLVENSVDGYHGLPTHQTYFDYVAKVGGMAMGDQPKKFGGTARALGGGHAVVETWVPWGRPVARWVPQMGEEVRPEIEEVKRRLVERDGPERADRIAEHNRNLIIYPNTIINDILAVTVRTMYPVAPDFMEVNAWALAPVEEQGALLHARLQNFLEFLGPGGFATPDDVEALESCQIGFKAGGQEWNDISRGMRTAGPAAETDELQIRAWWRAWSAQMDGLPIGDCDDAPLEPAGSAPTVGVG